MKYIYFTVGPSQVYPTFKKHLQAAIKADIPSISHRGKLFGEIFTHTTKNLRQLLNIPNTHRIFFLSSALESMERIIQNTVGKTSFHFVNGAFGKRFYKTALELGKDAEKEEAPYGSGFQLNSIKIPQKSELICITQNDTSTGVSLPMTDIHNLKDKYPDTLIAIDVVSSIPYVEIDFTKIDIAFFSVQKGFGLPAGLCVLIVNEKAIDKARELQDKQISIGSYHNFLSLLEMEVKLQTPETPNVLNIYLLGKVCEDMNKKGIERIRKEMKKKADMIYDFFDKHETYKPFINDKIFRSDTTIVINLKDHAKEVLYKLSKKGYVAGSGYGKNKNNHIRIANFPAHKITDVKKLLKYFE